jgi:PBP1b-binding outer membrane lipoprotein LpoB
MRLRFIVVVALLIAGCATRYIKPTTVQNPAPTEKFSAFGTSTRVIGFPIFGTERE